MLKRVAEKGTAGLAGELALDCISTSASKQRSLGNFYSRRAASSSGEAFRLTSSNILTAVSTSMASCRDAFEPAILFSLELDSRLLPKQDMELVLDELDNLRCILGEAGVGTSSTT